MTCSGFCTTAKCEELESQIQSLHSTVELLQKFLEGHILQPIPMAHNYEPSVTVDVIVQDNQPGKDLKVDVTIDNVNAYGLATLPSINSLNVQVLDLGNNNFLFDVYIDDLVGSAEFQITQPQINLDFFELQPNNFGLSMTVGTQQAQDNFTITLPDEKVISNLKLSGSYYNDILTLTNVSSG